jgi:hypothetical protein
LPRIVQHPQGDCVHSLKTVIFKGCYLTCVIKHKIYLQNTKILIYFKFYFTSYITNLLKPDSLNKYSKFFQRTVYNATKNVGKFGKKIYVVIHEEHLVAILKK